MLMARRQRPSGGSFRLGLRRRARAPKPLPAALRRRKAGRLALLKPKQVRQGWLEPYRAFWAAKPGGRYLALYQHAKTTIKEPLWRKALLVTTGSVLAVGGTILTISPLPFGWAIAVPGSMLLSSRSQRSARFLDALELRLHSLTNRRKAKRDAAKADHPETPPIETAQPPAKPTRTFKLRLRRSR